MRVDQHRLINANGAPAPFRQSPNIGGALTPRFLVMHYTAGSNAKGSVDWLCNPAAKASAHVVVGRDGSITQLVPLNVQAWHAGVSQWQGVSGLNAHSIGIEIDNAGVLNGGPGSWRTAWSTAVKDKDAVQLSHKFDGKLRGWHTYTTIQLEAVRELAAVLVDAYSLEDVIGHDDIAPGRKFDPGPAFPLSSMRAAAVGRAADAPEIWVTMTELNIRTGPGTEFTKIIPQPLPKGAQLNVIAEQGLWKQVDVLAQVGTEMDIVGWVHGRYIARRP